MTTLNIKWQRSYGLNPFQCTNILLISVRVSLLKREIRIVRSGQPK